MIVPHRGSQHVGFSVFGWLLSALPLLPPDHLDGAEQPRHRLPRPAGLGGDGRNGAEVLG